MDAIKLIEKEKNYLWERIKVIEAELDKVKELANSKVSDYEDSAKESASKTRGAFNKAAELRNKAEKKFGELVKLSNSISSMANSGKKELKDIRTKTTNIANLESQVSRLKQSSETKVQSIEKFINKIEDELNYTVDLLEKYEGLDEQLEVATEQVEKINAHNSESSSIVSSSNKLLKDLKDTRNEILGYYRHFQDENGDAKAKFEAGLKQELEAAFDELKSNFHQSQEEIERFQTSILGKYENVAKHYELQVSKFLNQNKETYSNLYAEIEGLKPGAMSKGLSEKFKIKRVAEEQELKTSKASFQKYIYLLMFGSLIPFLFPFVEMLRSETTLKFIDLFKEMPSLYLAMLPFYVPGVWLAFSANKQVNLSKRLIEEYTHKEVMSGTYQGLAKQIEEMESQHETSKELKNTLLANLVEANSENPGKLISDYNSSDHPLETLLKGGSQINKLLEKLIKNPTLFNSILDKFPDLADKHSNESKPAKPNGSTKKNGDAREITGAQE